MKTKTNVKAAGSLSQGLSQMIARQKAMQAMQKMYKAGRNAARQLA